MDEQFKKYLKIVERNLISIPNFEKNDIIKEIESSFLEMKNENLTTEEILNKLGDPKLLAESYIDPSNKKEVNFWTKLFKIFTFANLIVFPVLLVIVPTFAGLAIGFIFAGLLTPVLAIGKLLINLFNISVPYISSFKFNFFHFTIVDPFTTFLISIPISIIFIGIGYLFWILLLYSLKLLKTIAKDLNI